MMRGDAPDMTVDELLENDEDDEFSLTEEGLAEQRAEIEEMDAAASVITTLASIGRLFTDGEITAAEMEARMDDHIEWAEDHDIELP